MTTQSLERGNAIQKDLHQLKRQVSLLQKDNLTILRELEHPCDYSVIESGVDINKKVIIYAQKLLIERITKLEKEFKNL